jgi:hypothetical protein
MAYQPMCDECGQRIPFSEARLTVSPTGGQCWVCENCLDDPACGRHVLGEKQGEPVPLDLDLPLIPLTPAAIDLLQFDLQVEGAK